MKREPLLVYFGHHKCASTWLAGISHQVCHALGFKHIIVHSTSILNSSLGDFVRTNRIEFLSYVNANIDFVSELDQFLGFHVIRDPRDIVVSGYFSHRFSHPTSDDWQELTKHREHLNDVSEEEGIFLEMKFDETTFNDLYNWNYNQPNVLELKMEELITSPYEEMVRVYSFLNIADDDTGLLNTARFFLASINNKLYFKSKGIYPFRINSLKIPVSQLLGIVYDNRFAKKAEGRQHGQENLMSHYRKGVPGDWVNHFNAEHREYFKDHYNDLLLKLGYETSSDW
jgi:hypothetical protein